MSTKDALLVGIRLGHGWVCIVLPMQVGSVRYNDQPDEDTLFSEEKERKKERKGGGGRRKYCRSHQHLDFSDLDEVRLELARTYAHGCTKEVALGVLYHNTESALLYY